MDLLKATKIDIREAYHNAQEIMKEPDEKDFYARISCTVFIPMLKKNSKGFRRIGVLLFDDAGEPIGKIYKPVYNCMVMKNYDLRLLPCGYFAMIAHEEEKKDG